VEVKSDDGSNSGAGDGNLDGGDGSGGGDYSDNGEGSEGSLDGGDGSASGMVAAVWYQHFLRMLE